MIDCRLDKKWKRLIRFDPTIPCIFGISRSKPPIPEAVNRRQLLLMACATGLKIGLGSFYAPLRPPRRSGVVEISLPPFTLLVMLFEPSG